MAKYWQKYAYALLLCFLMLQQCLVHEIWNSGNFCPMSALCLSRRLDLYKLAKTHLIRNSYRTIGWAFSKFYQTLTYTNQIPKRWQNFISHICQGYSSVQHILDIVFRYFHNFVQLAHRFYEHSQAQVNGSVQERRNSNANALAGRLSCTKPSTWALLWW